MVFIEMRNHSEGSAYMELLSGRSTARRSPSRSPGRLRVEILREYLKLYINIERIRQVWRWEIKK